MNIKEEVVHDVLLNINNTLVVLSDTTMLESDKEEMRTNLETAFNMLKKDSGMTEEDIFE